MFAAPLNINPLIQQQIPVEDWGTNVISLGFAGRTNGDTYRVLAAYDGTTVTVTGKVVTVQNWGPPATVTKTSKTVTTNLDAGQFAEMILDGPAVFQANQPIQVAHFSNGEDYDQIPDPSDNGDPCEVLLPPVGHYLATTVVTLTNDLPYQIAGDFTNNYLNLFVPQLATNSTYVDSSLVVATNFVPIGVSGYYGAHITITNSGAHTITSSQPVGVEVYGWGYHDAYGYFGGMIK